MNPEIANYIQTQIATVKQELRNEVTNLVRQEVKTMLEKINKKLDDTHESLKKETSNAIIARSSEVSLAAQQDIEKAVTARLDKKYGKQLNSALEMYQYQNFDADDLITKYRHQVVNDEVKRDQKLLTNKGNNKHVITEHMQLVFDYATDD